MLISTLSLLLAGAPAVPLKQIPEGVRHDLQCVNAALLAKQNSGSAVDDKAAIVFGFYSGRLSAEDGFRFQGTPGTHFIYESKLELFTAIKKCYERELELTPKTNLNDEILNKE